MTPSHHLRKGFFYHESRTKTFKCCGGAPACRRRSSPHSSASAGSRSPSGSLTQPPPSSTSSPRWRTSFTSVLMSWWGSCRRKTPPRSSPGSRRPLPQAGDGACCRGSCGRHRRCFAYGWAAAFFSPSSSEQPMEPSLSQVQTLSLPALRQSLVATFFDLAAAERFGLRPLFPGGRPAQACQGSIFSMPSPCDWTSGETKRAA